MCAIDPIGSHTHTDQPMANEQTLSKKRVRVLPVVTKKEWKRAKTDECKAALIERTVCASVHPYHSIALPKRIFKQQSQNNEQTFIYTCPLCSNGYFVGWSTGGKKMEALGDAITNMYVGHTKQGLSIVCSHIPPVRATTSWYCPECPTESILEKISLIGQTVFCKNGTFTSCTKCARPTQYLSKPCCVFSGAFLLLIIHPQFCPKRRDSCAEAALRTKPKKANSSKRPPRTAAGSTGARERPSTASQSSPWRAWNREIHGKRIIRVGFTAFLATSRSSQYQQRRSERSIGNGTRAGNDRQKGHGCDEQGRMPIEYINRTRIKKT